MKIVACENCKHFKFLAYIHGFATYDCSLKKPICRYYKDDDGLLRLLCKNFDFKEKEVKE